MHAHTDQGMGDLDLRLDLKLDWGEIFIFISIYLFSDFYFV